MPAKQGFTFEESLITGLLGGPSSPNTRPLELVKAKNSAPIVTPTRFGEPGQGVSVPNLINAGNLGTSNLGNRFDDLDTPGQTQGIELSSDPVQDNFEDPFAELSLDPSQTTSNFSGNQSAKSFNPNAPPLPSGNPGPPAPPAGAVVAWGYNAYNYIDKFDDMDTANQVSNGIQLVGQGISIFSGPYAGPVFAATMIITGMAQMMGNMTGSKKSETQTRRDYYRDRLEASDMAYVGEDGSHKIQLADGTIFDIGLDGGHKLQNKGINIDGKTERHYYDVDFSNPVAQETANYAETLSIVLFGTGTGALMTGHLTNAATSKDPDDLGNAVVNLKDLAIRSGVTYEQGVEILKGAFQISDSTGIQIKTREQDRLEDQRKADMGGTDGTGRSFSPTGGPRINKHNFMSPEKQAVLLDYWYKLWFGSSKPSTGSGFIAESTPTEIGA